jgi:hypothetical protein
MNLCLCAHMCVLKLKEMTEGFPGRDMNFAEAMLP